MKADAAAPFATPLSNPIARFTLALFGLAPASLALIVLRLTLARPFFASGLTRWDGWFTLSFGAKVLFSDEYRLHLFGQEIPFPQPELVATMASTAEIVLPILLAFGFLTRYAALGLLGMTAVIQFVYPDAWQTSICPGRRWRWRSWPSARAPCRSTGSSASTGRRPGGPRRDGFAAESQSRAPLTAPQRRGFKRRR